MTLNEILANGYKVEIEALYDEFDDSYVRMHLTLSKLGKKKTAAYIDCMKGIVKDEVFTHEIINKLIKLAYDAESSTT